MANLNNAYDVLMNSNPVANFDIVEIRRLVKEEGLSSALKYLWSLPPERQESARREDSGLVDSVRSYVVRTLAEHLGAGE